MSSDSVLEEKIDEELLNEDNKLRVLIVEQEKIKYEYEVAKKLTNPYEFDATHFLPNTTPMSLPVFYEIASKLILNAQERAGIKKSKRVKLIEEYPPEPFDDYGDEVIAYRLLKREPALMNTKGTSRPHRKSTYSHQAMTPDFPNKTIVIESRPIDHVIEFNCWAKSNKLANARALWLEKLFVNHAWAFEVQGCERFYWKNRGPDTYMTTGGQRLFYRPVNFFVRFREFEIKAHPNIKQILFEVKPDNTKSSIS